MEPPALLLHPSSPIGPSTSPLLSSTPNSKNSSPVSSASSHTHAPSAYAPSTAATSTSDADKDRDANAPRNSSESTIFSIYSMYSERRRTWRKSALANSPHLARELEEACGQREEGTDEGSDSFFRGPVSRKSSSGSRFFAGSGEGENVDDSPNQSLYQPSRSRSRQRQHLSGTSAFLDSTRNSSEVAYSSGSFTYSYTQEPQLPAKDSLPQSVSAPVIGGSRPGSGTRLGLGLAADVRDSKLEPTDSDKFVDLGGSIVRATNQPELGFQLNQPVPHSGKVHLNRFTPPLPRSQSQLLFEDGAKKNGWEGEQQERPRPPRGQPPAHSNSIAQPAPKMAATTMTAFATHARNDSTSTSTHFGTALSHGMCTSVEGSIAGHGRYTTAPQSAESDLPPTFSFASVGRRASPAPSTTSTQRFRVMNPSPPSPSPPPIDPREQANHRSHASGSMASRPSMTSQKELPPPPLPSPGPASSSSRPQPVTEVAADVKAVKGVNEGPLPDEEPESFFVRNTYAQLDVTGVKGDGYEDGIERTRAKLGYDRRSVQLAAMNDAKQSPAQGEIPAKELDLLSNVDRYGFIAPPSHERMVLLPSTAFSRHLAPNTRTALNASPAPPPLTSVPKPPSIPKDRERRRLSKWSEMLQSEKRDTGGNVSVWRVQPSKERKLRSRVYKGVPDAWRAAAWEVLIARFVAAQKGRKSIEARELEALLVDLRKEYRSSIDKPSSYDVQIDLDVPRTINGHVLFKTRYGHGQRSLFHTLHSFSLRCKDCGYCQGMGPLAATLLSYYEPEKVYACLVHFHDEYRMHDIFLPGFPGLLEAIYLQERLLERMLPSVYASFKKNMISTTSYATKWYITLFANSVPFQTQLRLWDAFFIDGRDVFVVTAVAITWALRDHLMSPQANFETVLSLLSSFFVPEDEDALMRWIEKALGDQKLRADMERWREEWQALVKEGKDGGVLL